jgi:hypothetical protein
MQPNFQRMRTQVEARQRSKLTDVSVKLVIYEAFVKGKTRSSEHLARLVHDLYFEPKYEEFKPRTVSYYLHFLLRNPNTIRQT